MTSINITIDPTLSAVDAAIEAAQSRSMRPYLGMSAIGNPCERALWYQFRWAIQPEFNAATLYRFADGHKSEDIMAERLRMVKGIELYTVGADGNQFGFSDFGGHFRGHMDGAIKGLLQAPKTWHVWEHKATNEAKFKKLGKLKQELGEKNALKEWDYTYYAQAILYMHYSGMERHYLTCATAGTRDHISVRTEANPDEAKKLIAKAERIIFSDRAPMPISTDASFYLCKWCPAKGFCFPDVYGQQKPLLNYRTCALVTPQRDGTWTRKGQVIHFDMQSQTPDDHVLHPDMVPWKMLDGLDDETAVYEIDGKPVANGKPRPGVFSSSEILANPQACASGNKQIDAIRNTFNARVIE